MDVETHFRDNQKEGTGNWKQKREGKQIAEKEASENTDSNLPSWRSAKRAVPGMCMWAAGKPRRQELTTPNNKIRNVLNIFREYESEEQKSLLIFLLSATRENEFIRVILECEGRVFKIRHKNRKWN